jgi:hypothetical protein
MTNKKLKKAEKIKKKIIEKNSSIMTIDDEF